MSAMNIMGFLITAVVSYLIGSVNFAIIISYINKKDDVRNYGSGNAGMTNMLRTYGKKAAILTASGDFIKGIVAIVLARMVVFPLFGIDFIDAGYIAGIFVFLGHVFPIYFGFKGGKGVMTTLGIVLAIDPIVFLALVAICIPAILLSRTVSVGAIIGAVLFPIFTVLSNKIQNQPYKYDLICATLIVIMVIILHRENIKRLLNGTENRFEKKLKK